MTAGASTYDPGARRKTPLALRLEARIRRDGPLTIEHYMQACLQDAEHGYYRTKMAIGRGGDFITAPEISQVFGELIGLWCAVVWRQMGSPAKLNLVELGPGRGTLLKDALRAARIVPGFLDAIDVHLVESNEPLRAIQAGTLAASGITPRWLPSLLAVEETALEVNALGAFATHAAVALAPTIVVANEFLDARPIRQFVRGDGIWHERTVELDAQGNLAFGRVSQPARGVGDLGDRAGGARPGDIAEIGSSLGDVTVPLQEIARHSPVAGLLVDYGHTTPRTGDTLQAVRNHAFEHPLTSPGEADLTTQVDFDWISRDLADAGFAVDGPTTQTEFLGALGIVERASKLMSANPSLANEIEAGIARLTSPAGMGSRFKVAGFRTRALPVLPGLARLAGRA